MITFLGSVFVLSGDVSAQRLRDRLVRPQLPQHGQVPGRQPAPQDQQNEIRECAQLGTGSQSCFWTYKFNASACPSGRCSKMVIYFSGGQMSCPNPSANDNYLGYYSQAGYLAVCARLYQDGEGAAQYPYYREGSRADLLVRTIVAHPEITSHWTGENLLISGVSHGATAPVAAMANSNVDEQPAWRGSRSTGACFLDGIYDLQAEFSFLRAGMCGERNSIASYQRMYSRYCTWTGRLLPRTWPQPNTCMTEDVMRDSTVNANLSTLEINQWKLVECGSALGPCLKDVVPRAPIETLCSRLGSDGVHQCQFQAFPELSHIECGMKPEPNQACIQWFDGIVAAKK